MALCVYVFHKNVDCKPAEAIQDSSKLPTMEFPLNLKWTPGPDMPFAMTGYIQSVIIQEMMYVGGGNASPIGNMYTVMTYHIISRKWFQLPQYTTRSFAMVVIHNQLALVGGRDQNNKDTNVLGVWDFDSSAWTHPYKCMPSSRTDSSTIFFKQWLIVAGGVSGGIKLSSVIVLDTSCKQWFKAPSTPVPWCSMRSAVVGDTWYLMGGGDDMVSTHKMYSVSLSTLISHMKNTRKNIWNTKLSLGLLWSTPLCLGESLVAVGGKESGTLQVVSTILQYTPDTDTWVKVGELPSPWYDCASSVSTDVSHILVAGGSKCQNLFSSFI